MKMYEQLTCEQTKDFCKPCPLTLASMTQFREGWGFQVSLYHSGGSVISLILRSPKYDDIITVLWGSKWILDIEISFSIFLDGLFS